ncbi:shikimate kinase [Winogradskyella sp.]|jgi:shikimate kinase|uniref:shikimate kinase n=1 Tax=Winogradskyella sp. TaxID=1883156 RepID=UPI0025D98F25|nr:shikimate kinase [Winogradskyella sp.]MCT4630991.1 shikimate kinase [Winogradskyella sp.]
MVVVLMGYMGSGKSTIGKGLATVLSYKSLDLDSYISEKELASIPEIFKQKGEIYFRKKETFYLNEILSSEDNIILSLGGGTPCYGKNLSVLLNNDKIKLFYLKLSIPLLTKRLFSEIEKRPVISHLKTEDELTEFIGKHLFERTQYYNEAHYTINTDHKMQQDVIEDILMCLI